MVALLNEVYGEDFLTSASNIYPSEFYESHDDMLDNMVDDDLYHSYENEIKKVEKKQKIKEKKIETFNNDFTCDDLNSHLLTCQVCQKNVKNRYSKLDDSKKKIIDIFIFLLLGILILFILDIFVRLGKMMK